MSNLFIKLFKDGDTYKYLGINENISYVGAFNKEKVTKQYYTRVKKIWKSELSSFNKVIAHTCTDDHTWSNRLDNRRNKGDRYKNT